MPVYLIKALGPAKSLSPGLAEMHRLLVIDDSFVAVADDLAVNGAVYRKFNILC